MVLSISSHEASMLYLLSTRAPLGRVLQSGTEACKQCGTQNPAGGHQCTPKCLIWGGSHVTGSKECQDKLKKARELCNNHGGSRGGGGGGHDSRHRSQDDRSKKLRWFSSEGKTSRSRSRSRASRSRSRSRSRSFLPLVPLVGQQQQQQKQNTPTRKTGVKVSWGAGNPWFAPHSGEEVNTFGTGP